MVSTFRLPESRIALTSSFGPELLSQSPGLDPILKIQAIEPILPMDLMLWREFILRIWPQLQE
jgi:hypothetical protein